MIVVDTSVWIDYFRRSETVEVELLRDMIDGDRGIAITDLVLSELLQGAPDERQASRLERRLRGFDVVRLEGLDDFRRSARLYRSARAHGITIRSTIDCLIASVCIREDLGLLHSDVDFDRLASCSALRIVRPPSPSD